VSAARYVALVGAAASLGAVFLLFEPDPGLLRGEGPMFPVLASDEREIVLAGDVMLARDVADSLRRRSRRFSYPFDAVREVIARADIAFANLESQISGRGQPVSPTKIAFNAPPEAADGLRASGLDVVSVANNHTLDFGPVALADSEALLAKAGLLSLGLSTNDAPQEPVVVDARGVSVGFLGYCDPRRPSTCHSVFRQFARGPARSTDDALARDIAALRPRVDVLVVSLHWGTEKRLEPAANQRALAHHIIDLGADIVAGHHPHVQQEPEIYKRGVILYSMGNFVFDSDSSDELRDSRLYRIVVATDGVRALSYLPLEIARGDWQPRPTQRTFVVLHEPPS